MSCLIRKPIIDDEISVNVAQLQHSVPFRRPVLIWLMAVITMMFIPSSQAEDLEQANEAFDRGEYVTALELYEALAEQGEPQAQYQLGLMYEQGLGTDVDGQVASSWYQKAAQQQSPPAVSALAALHLSGTGVIQNFKESLRLYRQAAEQGYAPAQYHLGIAYADGTGTFRDPVRAHMWFNIAAANGYAEAGASRQRLASSMGQSEITLAQARAQQCLDKNYIDC